MSVNPQAMSTLVDCDWPGNARELENALERAMVCSQGGTIEPEAFPRSVAREEVARFSRGRGQEGHASSGAGGEPVESRARGGAAEDRSNHAVANVRRWSIVATRG